MPEPDPPPRRGRPPLADGDRRTEQLTLRATTAEVDAAYRLALQLNQPLASLLREGLRRVTRNPPRRDLDE